MGIITDNFMLKNKTGAELYHRFAEGRPIIDYHCHLSPAEIAEDHRFRSATELFLGGDHYKWRAMRSAGVPEETITGPAPDEEKFRAWAATMPLLIGNPLYHWSALELCRYFDVNEPLTPESAGRIYAACNEKLADPAFSARNLILRSGVKALCTTDDPQDDLRYHRQLKAEGYAVKVLPTFRPDKSLLIEKDTFVPYMQANGITSYAELVAWLGRRVAYFAENGCRLSDHSLEALSYRSGDPCVAFDKKMRGETPTADEIAAYRSALLLELGRLYTKYDMAMQLHIGAMRNNSRRMFEKLGPDSGFDSINDFRVAEGLSALLSAMEYEDALPKTVLYTLNPKDNYVLGSMIGNFQRAPIAGRMQFGSGWWFNDNRDGMEAQMTALANLGLLSRFVGMLTDSRSLVSYPRHEYFRRILCNLIGRWVEEGEYPDDRETLGGIIEDISYRNAEKYFGF